MNVDKTKEAEQHLKESIQEVLLQYYRECGGTITSLSIEPNFKPLFFGSPQQMVMQCNPSIKIDKYI